MKKFLLRTALVLVVVCVGYGAYAAWRAYNAVTLNVRNMDVREVVRKIERQTRLTIMVHSNVQGKVTLNVKRMPLEEVLEIMAYDLRTSNVTIVREFASLLPPIMADAHQLQQIFVNILSNARQAIEPVQRDGRIVIRIRRG